MWELNVVNRYKYENVSKDINFAYDSCLNYFCHAHRHLEMHYVADGELDIFLSTKWFKVKKDDMVIIFPYQIHNTKHSTGMIYSTVFNLDLLDLFSNTFLNYTCNEPIIHKPQSDYLHVLMKHAWEIYSSKPLFVYEELISTLSAIAGYSLSCLNDKLTKTLDIPQGISIKNIINYCIENACNTDISLGKVGKHFHLSKTYVSHLFSDKIGMTFVEFINSQRIEQACKLLKFSNMTITEIQYACGFNSQATFNRCFKHLLDTTPRTYRQTESELQKS